MECANCGTTNPPLYYHRTHFEPPTWIRLCKTCYNEAWGTGITLTEIFTEYTPTVKGASQYGRYKADYIIIKKPNPPTITEQDLKIYIQSLQRRFPKEGFYLGKTTWRGKTLHKIAKRKNKHTQGRIPLYFDLKNQKIYIEKKTLQTQERLANYIIMVTLGSLGITQSKYTNGIRRE